MQLAAWAPNHNTGYDNPLVEAAENAVIAAERVCAFFEFDAQAVLNELPQAEQEAVYLAGSLMVSNDVLNRFLSIEVQREDFTRVHSLLSAAAVKPAGAGEEAVSDA
jgi:hypothetical protein